MSKKKGTSCTFSPTCTFLWEEKCCGARRGAVWLRGTCGERSGAAVRAERGAGPVPGSGLGGVASRTGSSPAAAAAAAAEGLAPSARSVRLSPGFPSSIPATPFHTLARTCTPLQQMGCSRVCVRVSASPGAHPLLLLPESVPAAATAKQLLHRAAQCTRIWFAAAACCDRVHRNPELMALSLRPQNSLVFIESEPSGLAQEYLTLIL